MQHTSNLWFSITLFTYVLSMVSIEPLYTFFIIVARTIRIDELEDISSEAITKEKL